MITVKMAISGVTRVHVGSRGVDKHEAGRSNMMPRGAFPAVLSGCVAIGNRSETAERERERGRGRESFQQRPQ
jgi:hypothetical protein